MRTVHLDPPRGTFPFVPVCGSWGAADSDGTTEPRGVTCPACLVVMARVAAEVPAAVAVRLHPG